MQGLSAYPRVHCSIWAAAHSTKARIGVKRFQILSLQDKFRKLKSEFVCTAPSLPNPIWVCNASLEQEATSEESFLSRTEETIVTADTVAVEEGPTVQVKFVLQKQCHFGERFNVVGNDPLFGNWNPESAIAMEWAEGHIWSAEVNVPVGKRIEFKFVLTGENEEIEWQPGPNRFFETVEDISPLIVAELWDSADEEAPIELPEESSGLIEEIDPTSTPEFSPIAKVVDEIESEIGEGQPLSSESDSGESSETVAELPFVDVNVVAPAVEALVDDRSAA